MNLTMLLEMATMGFGERILFAGYDGVVEEIGFRSTKVRTLVGHLVTIPNAGGRMSIGKYSGERIPRVVNTRFPIGQISRGLFRRLEIARPIAEYVTQMTKMQAAMTSHARGGTGITYAKRTASMTRAGAAGMKFENAMPIR